MHLLKNQPIEINNTIIQQDIACVVVNANTEIGTILLGEQFRTVSRPYDFYNPVPFTVAEVVTTNTLFTEASHEM